MQLRQRFEPPNQRNRWDNPIFKIQLSINDKKVNIEVAKSINSSGDHTMTANQSGIDNNTSTESTKQPTTSSWKRKKHVVCDTPPFSLPIPPTVASLPPPPTNLGQSPPLLLLNKDPTQNGSNQIINDINILEYTQESHTDIQTSDQRSPLHNIFENILNYFTTSAAPVPHSSTVPTPHADAQLLYLLDSISQEIAHLLLNHQKESEALLGPNGSSPLLLETYQRTVTLPRHITISEMQRHRRQYVKMNSQHPPASAIAIGSTFIDFLLSQL